MIELAYCLEADVRARCDTDVTTAEMPNLIAEASAWLDLKITMASLTIPMRRLLAATLTAILCMLKDPNAQALGEYREDREAALLKLNKMFDDMLKDAEAELGSGIGMSYSYARIPIGVPPE